MSFIEAGNLHKEATAAVLQWIQEKHGEKVAEWWFWEATPMPCWLPSKDQLLDGLKFAAGEISVADFQRRVSGKF